MNQQKEIGMEAINTVKHKGIILAGGQGTRLGDVTKVTSKQLLPVYDKPMIYYPLTNLIRMGIKEIMLITSPEHMASYHRLAYEVNEHADFGLIRVARQLAPKGLAESFIIAEKWLKGSPSVLILGDNIFYGSDIQPLCYHALHNDIQDVEDENYGLVYIFAYQVANPQAYGVVEYESVSIGNIDKSRATSLEEKPKKPKSSYAVPGIYIVDEEAPEIAKQLEPSARGELEITDLLRTYMKREKLEVLGLSQETAWFDAGTPDGLLDASEFVAATQRRTGRKIGCPFQAIDYNKQVGVY